MLEEGSKTPPTGILGAYKALNEDQRGALTTAAFNILAPIFTWWWAHRIFRNSWNKVMPTTFGLPTITFWQGAAMVGVAQMLLRGYKVPTFTWDKTKKAVKSRWSWR